MPEKVSPLAGKTIEPSMLVNVPRRHCQVKRDWRRDDGRARLTA